MHTEQHPLAGQVVKISDGVADPVQKAVQPGAEYTIEDWWDRMAGRSWREVHGNPACLHYAVRAKSNDLPVDEEVLYGKIGPFGHLVHVSEINW